MNNFRALMDSAVLWHPPTPAANPPSGRLEQGKADEDRTAVADHGGITSWGGVVGSKFNTYVAVSLRTALIQPKGASS